MKAGERVIWLRSPRHSIWDGWRLERIPGEIVRICRRRIRIRIWLRGKERIVIVDPENVLCDGEDDPKQEEFINHHLSIINGHFDAKGPLANDK